MFHLTILRDKTQDRISAASRPARRRGSARRVSAAGLRRRPRTLRDTPARRRRRRGCRQERRARRREPRRFPGMAGTRAERQWACQHNKIMYFLNQKPLDIAIPYAQCRYPRRQFRCASRLLIRSCACAAPARGRLVTRSAGIRAQGHSPVEAARAGRPAWRAERCGPPFRLHRFARAAVDPADSASAATRPARGEEPAGPFRTGACMSPARQLRRTLARLAGAAIRSFPSPLPSGIVGAGSRSGRSERRCRCGASSAARRRRAEAGARSRVPAV